MCLRWTVWVLMLLFTAQAACIVSDNNTFLVRGQGMLAAPAIVSVTAGGAFPTSDPLKLCVLCAGTSPNASVPTVLLEAGGGAGLGSMVPLMNELARARGVRVCAYDRAGYGFSQSGYPFQNKTRQSLEIFDALSSLGERGPYVCAGHSAGGSACRALRYYFPANISGLVMLDAYCNSGPCNIEVKWNEAWGMPNAYAATYAIRVALTDALRWLAVVALTRAAIAPVQTPNNANSGGNIGWNTQYTHFRPGPNEQAAGEFENLLFTTPNVTGPIPLLVATAGMQDTCADRGFAPESKNCVSWEQQRNASQTEIARYVATSPYGRWTDCGSDCDHGFVQKQPKIAADYVMEVVGAVVRGGA